MQKDKKFICDLAQKAGEIHLTYAEKVSIYKKEGMANLVTDADIESEKYIIETIRKNFPNDNIISEETENNSYEEKAKGSFWVIDPLDGTNNFANKRNFSVCSIAYGEKREILMGAIYNPFSKEMYFAEKGKGSYCNDTKLEMAKLPDDHHMTVATGPSNEHEETKINLETLLKIKPTPHFRAFGASALEIAWIASGKIDVYLHSKFGGPWDFAAAYLIVMEAGGYAVNFKGEPVDFLTKDAIIGHKNFITNIIPQINV